MFKIFERKPFKAKLTQSDDSKTKKLVYIIGEIVIFFIVFSFIESTISPGSLVVKNIKEPNAVVESSGGQYYGTVVNTLYQGKGKFKYLKDGIYDGDFSASKRSGTGTFRWNNGDVYTGTWKNDLMDEGTYTFQDGRVYKGQFQNNNLLKGYIDLGKAAATYGFVSFTANIETGKINSVNYKKNNGFSFNGSVNGYAEIKYASGNTYVGNVSNGVRNGNGTYKWMSGNSILAYYSGNWANDSMDGSGKYYYSSNDYPYISGTFVKGKLEGRAQYYKSAQQAFTTTWLSGKCKNNNG